MDALETLWLTGHNLSAVGLPAGLLEGLPHLKNLHIGLNQLNSLPEALLRPVCGTLQSVVLSLNLLTTLPAELFEGCNKLRYLFAAQNELVELPPGMLLSLSNLTFMDLSGNDAELCLRPEDIPPSLKLTFAPVDCVPLAPPLAPPPQVAPPPQQQSPSPVTQSDTAAPAAGPPPPLPDVQPPPPPPPPPPLQLSPPNPMPPNLPLPRPLPAKYIVLYDGGYGPASRDGSNCQSVLEADDAALPVGFGGSGVRGIRAFFQVQCVMAIVLNETLPAGTVSAWMRPAKGSTAAYDFDDMSLSLVSWDGVNPTVRLAQASVEGAVAANIGALPLADGQWSHISMEVGEAGANELWLGSSDINAGSVSVDFDMVLFEPAVVETEAPTVTPSEVPTQAPTVTPSEVPTQAPTATQVPAPVPMTVPAPAPAPAPAPSNATAAAAPLPAPAPAPAPAPLKVPPQTGGGTTDASTEAPTAVPVADDDSTTLAPSEAPSEASSEAPTQAPSMAPTLPAPPPPPPPQPPQPPPASRVVLFNGGYASNVTDGSTCLTSLEASSALPEALGGSPDPSAAGVRAAYKFQCVFALAVSATAAPLPRGRLTLWLRADAAAGGAAAQNGVGDPDTELINSLTLSVVKWTPPHTVQFLAVAGLAQAVAEGEGGVGGDVGATELSARVGEWLRLALDVPIGGGNEIWLGPDHPRSQPGMVDIDAVEIEPLD